VVASGPPFQTFVAGYYLAKASRCRLVLDYRDEWTECPFDFVDAGGSDHYWEQRCLRRADMVVFVTQSQLEHHLAAFPEVPRDRCVVIANGWAPAHEVDRDRAPSPAVSAGRVTLSFVGGLGAFAEPDEFLSTIEEVLERRPDLRRSLQLRFVGEKDTRAMDALRRFPFQEVFELNEHLPVPDAISMMRSSAALLLLNPPSFDRTLPGKLYEYIASGRPVVVFGDGGESASLIRELGAGTIIPGRDAVALERALDDLVGGTLDNNLGRIDAWLSTHSQSAMADRYFDELDRLVRPADDL
jgi:glycosyltransferase involved in cell wall biosynthesis